MPSLPAAPPAAERYRALYVWAISGAAALGGLLFGYDWVVIGGARQFFEPYFHLTSPALIGWANSCALLGCLLGSLVAGAAGERWGRKKLLIAAAAVFALSSALTGWAPTFAWFIVWRIAGGVAIGMASNVSPTYIAEVSPPPWRGRLVSLNQFTVVVGILAAQVVNLWIARPIPAAATAAMIRLSWNGQYAWRWMFTAVAVPAVVFLAAACWVPESPRWLAGKGQADRARGILERIGGPLYAARALGEIQLSLSSSLRSGAWRELFSPRLRRILAIGVALAVLQQWSGINVIFNYAGEIYRNAGYAPNDVFFNIVITGAINLAFTLVALATVDKLGRRPLLLAGCAGVAASHLLIGVAYHQGWKGLPVLLFTLCAIACYAMSLAPVAWVLIAEIFPNRVRGAGVSASVSALWIAAFALTYAFPWMNRALGAAGAFWTYAAICLVGLGFVYGAVPETRGKSLERIERELVGEPLEA